MNNRKIVIRKYGSEYLIEFHEKSSEIYYILAPSSSNEITEQCMIDWLEGKDISDTDAELHIVS